MVHLTNKQYAEVRRRYLALAQLAKEKELEATMGLSFHNRPEDADSFDFGYISIYKRGVDYALFGQHISRISETENDDCLGEDYYRENFYMWPGFMAAFDKAEDFINNYQKEA